MNPFVERHQDKITGVLSCFDCKAGIMARVQCTTHDVSFFKLHRWVEQRNGWQQWKLASLRKHIYRLRDLRQRMRAANERYLAVMAAIDHRDAGHKDIDKLSSPAKEPGRAFRGSNLLIKKVGHRYKYYLTTFGRGVLTTAPKLRKHPLYRHSAVMSHEISSHFCLLLSRYVGL